MPINSNLDINYTAVRLTNIQTSLDAAQTDVEATVGTPLNLSATERQLTPSVDTQRESFVRDAIEALGPLYGNLLGPEITLARAQNLWKYRNSSEELLVRLLELQDLLIDSVINAENICLKFTEDLRGNAERFKERNVPGADVVWERLKDLHTVSSGEPVPPIP